MSVSGIDGWNKAQGQWDSLTLHSRWRACVWRPSRCRAGCAGHDAAGWWLRGSGWLWRSIRMPLPGGAALSRHHLTKRCWPAGTRCLCACRCAGRLGMAWFVLGHPSKAHHWTGDTPPPQCGSSLWCSLRPLPPRQGHAISWSKRINSFIRKSALSYLKLWLWCFWCTYFQKATKLWQKAQLRPLY